MENNGIIVVVGSDNGGDLVEEVKRKLAEEGYDCSITFRDEGGLADAGQFRPEADIARWRDEIEMIEIKAEAVPVQETFLEFNRPRRDWEQRNRQRPRRRKRH